METSNVTELTVKRELAKTQTVVETKLQASGVTGVLGACASIALSVTESFNGEVRVAGTESVTVCYMTESGIQGGEQTVEFTDRVECAASALTRAVACGRVLDTDIMAIDESVIRLASVVEITVWEIATLTLPRPELPPTVYGNDKHIKCSSLAADFSAKTTVDGDELFKVDRLVSACARVYVTGAEAALDAVIVSGEAIIDVCGVRGDNTQNGEIIIPFTEEISASGARAGDVVSACARACRVEATETDDGFTFAVAMQICGEVWCRASADIISDAFSIDCELEKELREYELPDVRQSLCITEKVEGSVSLAEGDSADSIVALIGISYATESATTENGGIVVLGAITGTVVYYDADASAIKRAEVLVPVRLALDVDTQDGDTVRVCGDIGRLTVKLRRSGEIDLRAELKLCVISGGITHESVVAGVTECGVAADSSGTVSVLIASGGETLWDCAKVLRFKPEDIAAQNNNDYPLRRGDKIVIYRGNK